MRNLKKVFAVILTVALLATSLMVPALAAVSNEAEALKLQKIGLFAGNPEDLKLDEGVTRIQGLAFAIRAAGKEKEAFAMTDEEVAAELAKFVDSSEIPGWGRKYAAYAIKHGITVGVGNNKFAALDPISGTSFLVFLMKSGMGYADVTTANVIDVAVEAKVLTAGQAVNYGIKAALIRDDAAAILYGAAKNGVNANGKTFIQSLIDAGFVDQATAWENGFGTEPVPEALKVTNVTVLNNKQVLIAFNMELDKDSAETESNYAIDGSSTGFTAALQADKKSVILNLSAAKDQQSTAKVTVKSDLKAADKATSCTELKDHEVRFFDSTVPSFTGFEVRGPKTVRIFASEPIQALDTTKIKVNNGTVGLLIGANGTTHGISDDFSKYYVDVVFVADMVSGTTYSIELGEGTITDYAGAGFKNLKQTITVDYVKLVAPVTASVVEATQTSVKIKFSQPVDASKLSTSLFYHSLSTYRPNSFTPTTGYNDEYTLTFTSYPLAAGNANLYIKNKDGSAEIVDTYGNKLVSDLLTLTVSVNADTTAPVVKEVKAETPSKIVVEFDEVVNTSDAQNRLNYTFYKADGTKLTSTPVDSNGHPTTIPQYSASTKKVTINLSSPLSGGNYYLEIKNIKDTSLAENKLESVTVAFTVKDETAPTLQTAEIYDDNKVIVVKYDKQMGSSAVEASNYQLEVNGTRKALPSGTTLTLSSDGKVVTITLPSTIDNLDGTTDRIYVANVKDVNGNSIAFGSNVAISPASPPVVVALDYKEGYFEQKNVVVIYFDKEIANVDGSKITYTKPDSSTGSIAGVSIINEVTTAGGNTSRAKVIVNLPDGAMTGTNGAGVTSINFANDALTGTNGKKLVADNVAIANVADKLAPEIAKDSDDNYRVETVDENKNGKIDNIVITFTEPMKTQDVSLTTFEVSGYEITAVNASSNTVTLTIAEKEYSDTSALPALVIKGTIRDISGNVLATTGTVASKDTAAPTIIAAAYADVNNNSTVDEGDKVEITFSEAIKLKSGATAADLANDWNASNFFGTGATFEIVGDRVIVTLSTVEALTSTINITDTSNDVSIVDSANNLAVPAAAAVTISGI